MKTPIYLDFNIESTYLMSNELDLNKEDPIDLYTSNLLANPPYLNFQFVLAPRYYLKIYSPKDQNLSTIKIPIHKSPASHLKNKARILLSPSLSYGINSSYKVEYIEWIPLLEYTADISKKIVKTEYWYIPTLDENYVPQYPFNLYLNDYQYYTDRDWWNYPRLATEKISVVRSINTTNNTVEDILDPLKPYIFSFPNNYKSFTETIETELLIFNEETLKWDFSKKLTNSLLIRDSNTVDGELLLNGPTNTTIEYIMPFNSSHLIIEDV